MSDDDVRLLREAVDEAASVLPVSLDRADAVARAEALLALHERVAALALKAVADVDARELWRERSAGSTRTWLRTQPCGDRGQLGLSRALSERPLLARALEDGQVSVRTAAAVARELARVPAHVDADQLTGVLVDGLGDLMAVWAGAACLDPEPRQEAAFEARRDELAAAVRQGLDDCWSDAAGQLEPAFVLAARVLSPAEVEGGLALLVDALQPEAEADALAEREHRSRSLSLRKLKGGGWSLRAHLTDEVGQELCEALAAREDMHPLQQVAPRPRTPAEPGPVGAEDVFGVAPASADPVDVAAPGDEPTHGAAGPGLPLLREGGVEEGTPLPSKDQRAHDALARLLADLHAVRPGSGMPAAAHLTLVAPLAALDGQPGAPPGRLITARGEVPVRPARLRRLGCDSVLSAVLLDARGRPVGASGEHRHATERERRAMRAAWGSACGVNGCGLPGEVPHHAEPWWKSRATALKDLVPLCRHHHHDVHDGHTTLRLRDGRLIDERGWVTAG